MQIEKTDSSCGEFMRTVFDALPLPAFVVDQDVTIHDRNRAASELLGSGPELAIFGRAGEVMHCLHAAPRGCGKSEVCKFCGIRGTVTRALADGKVNRALHQAQLRTDGQIKTIDLVVTATRIAGTEPPKAVLILEDISELLMLRGLLPICAQCKKVRDNEQHWHELHQFLHTHMHLKISHGLCPDCFAEQMKAVQAME